MKTKRLSIVFALICLVACSVVLSACGSVVPCAWVRFESDGLVYYTSDMYGQTGDHIYIYETQEDADAKDYAITVRFDPRILGLDTMNDVKTQTVDISKWHDMTVIIYKSKTDTYSSSKKVYLNGTALTPSTTSDLDSLVSYTFKNVNLVRGNPNGKINGYVNVIEYK